MKLVLRDKNKRIIRGIEEVKFRSTSARHLICVTARAKGKLQLSPNVNDDEDITIEIDKKRFPKFSDPNRIIDSPAAFSGGTLHNLSKTVFFLVELTGEDHVIKLKTDKTPASATLEGLEVYVLEPGGKIDLKIARSAEDANRRPWLTFVVDDLPLYSFIIDATVYKRYRDSDDLKIIVDGEIKTHFEEKKEKPAKPIPLEWFYRFWYLAGSILMGKRVISSFKTKLPKGLHYVEIYADRMPYVESVKLDLSQTAAPVPPPNVRKYKDDLFGNDYNRFDQYILSSVEYWNKFFLSQEYPPLKSLDPNFVKAIIYRESRLGYYPDSNIVDVMQVWDERNETPQHMKPDEGYEKAASEFVNREEYKHMSYSYPIDRLPIKVTVPQESIFWGVRWLYHKAKFLKPDANENLTPPYARTWRPWEEALRKYNSNREVLENYMSEVLRVYHEGVDLDGNILWQD